VGIGSLTRMPLTGPLSRRRPARAARTPLRRSLGATTRALGRSSGSGLGVPTFPKTCCSHRP